MKLHLPAGLRSALMACFAAVSGVAIPATGAALGGAAVAVSFILTAAPAHAEAVVWDANWGISDAPSTIPDANVLTNIPAGTLYLSRNNSPYFTGGETVVRLADTTEGASGIVVFAGAGGVTDSADYSEGPLDADTWMKVTGGSYVLLVGGSYAQNYNSGEISSFTGDSHILLTAEDAQGQGPTVDFIVGGNHKDGQDAPFTGNSYISVEAGEVQGSIIGGGTSAHNDTAVFNGNSDIWVYKPLSTTSVTLVELPGNFIIGSNAGVNNYAPKLSQEGDSHVHADLSGFTPLAGAAAEMQKTLVGDAWVLTGGTSTHTGNSAVTVNGTAADGSNVLFTQPVLAGAWFNGIGTATLSGSSSLTVQGGSFSAALVGGSWLNAATATNVSSTTTGGSSVTLGGDTELSGDALVVGGSYVNTQAATVNSGALAVNIVPLINSDVFTQAAYRV